MNISHTIEIIHNVLRAAGCKMVLIEQSGKLNIKYKSDKSPVTLADYASNTLITKILIEEFPGIPVISEEDDSRSDKSEHSDMFWLLDPLDGTKEFIKGNGEYCISLALIKNGRPVQAYIYSPVQKVLWYAIKGEGAYRVRSDKVNKLPINGRKEEDHLLLLRSRSHHNREEALWHDKATASEPVIVEEQGSAIKFCIIAEGNADMYIKKGRIFAWDIAAGDLILSESGGCLLSYETEKEIIYRFDRSEMPFFFAGGYRIVNPRKWLL